MTEPPIQPQPQPDPQQPGRRYQPQPGQPYPQQPVVAPTKPKKPIFKKWWFRLIMIVAILIAVVASPLSIWLGHAAHLIWNGLQNFGS